MNINYLELARERMPNTPLLINVISQRVRQLNQGHRPLVKPEGSNMSNLDIALKEVAEGKMSAELGFAPQPKGEDLGVISL